MTSCSMLFYVKIETEDNEDESEDSDSESNGTLDLSKIREMRLVPSDPGQCILLSLSFPSTVPLVTIPLSLYPSLLLAYCHL